MLERLHISNLALIEDMALEFTDGINVLSGETGAGKSFILKALGFLLGERLTPDIVRPGAGRALVDAIFHTGDKELILRRELFAASGRSRFYVNDAASSQEAIRSLRQELISHTSQHAQQQLLQPGFQASLLEKRITNRALLQKRDQLLCELRELSNQIKSIRTKQAGLAEKRELLEMQASEIEKVSPADGEEEELERLRATAKNDISARQNYKQAMEILHGDEGPGLIQMLQDFERIVSRICGTEAESEIASIASFRQELSRIGGMIRKPQRAAENIDMNAIEERLFAFAQLKRKLKRSMPEILALKEEIKENLSFLDICALDLNRLEREETKLKENLTRVIDEIRPLRHASGELLARSLEQELAKLGFSEHVKVMPEYEAQEIWPGICEEKGRLNWAPNPGQRPQPLDKIASGGELSRFMLALGALSVQSNDTTFIFDEVDAGVGGLTLNKLADKMESLAESNQIILITHWPQLAARASKHFLISKEVREGQTYTQCVPLDMEKRKEELARMAGGGKEGADMAENLLKSRELQKSEQPDIQIENTNRPEDESKLKQRFNS